MWSKDTVAAGALAGSRPGHRRWLAGLAWAPEPFAVRADPPAPPAIPLSQTLELRDGRSGDSVAIQFRLEPPEASSARGKAPHA